MENRRHRAQSPACLSILGLVALVACAPVASEGDGSAAAVSALPEAVVTLAAPYQDLSTARLVPEDGCYWYQHAGPVETTLLPLRTPSGNPICTRPIETAAASG